MPKRCLIVGAAPSSHAGLDYVLRTQVFDAVYAADAGYATLTQRGINPHQVFGDFDSLGHVPKHSQVHQFSAHKDFTDLDLAAQYAFDAGYSELVICDAFSGRIDHTLGNFQLLVQFAQAGMAVWGITETEVIATLVAPGPCTALVFDEGAFGLCSVVSHSNESRGVIERGLEWSLTDATIPNIGTLGISNELLGAPACIGLAEGSLWVVFPLQEFERAHYEAAVPGCFIKA